MTSEALRALEGRISDADYSAKADLEQRVVLQRHLLAKLGYTPEAYPMPATPRVLRLP